MPDWQIMLQRIHNKISLFQICDLISVFKFGCFLFSKGDLGVYSINAQWSCFFFNSSWLSSTWIYDPFCSIEGFNNLTWKKLKSTDLENSHKRHSNKCKSPLWKYRYYFASRDPTNLFTELISSWLKSPDHYWPPLDHDILKGRWKKRSYYQG